MATQTEKIKDEASRIVEDLPDSATWDDIVCRIYIHQAIDDGIKDSDERRTVHVNEMRKKFGLPLLFNSLCRYGPQK